MRATVARRATNATPRTATNVSLDPALVGEAKVLGVNISQACEQGLAERVREARERAWLAENVHAIDAYNVWFEENGLPLAHLRQF